MRYNYNFFLIQQPNWWKKRWWLLPQKETRDGHHDCFSIFMYSANAQILLSSWYCNQHIAAKYLHRNGIHFRLL